MTETKQASHVVLEDGPDGLRAKEFGGAATQGFKVIDGTAGVLDFVPVLRALGATCIWTARKPELP